MTHDFTASACWLQKFKKRYEIRGRRICWEANSVDEEVVRRWKDDIPKIVDNFKISDTYNCDETRLFFNLLPERTLAVKGDPCHGGKRSKERLTVLLTTNADGTDKLTPLVIGKSAKPRCLKGVKSLPVQYEANKKAWMTGAIFTNYLEKLNARMRREKRKILMVLDNCPAHPSSLNFSNIKLAFLPPKCTSHTQPLDLGIIAAMKVQYRQLLVQRVVADIDAGKDVPKINFLQVCTIFSFHKLWNKTLL